MKTQGSARPDNLKPTEAVDHSATVGRTSPVSRWEGRTFGALVLAAFLLYGIGSALADQPAGLALVMLNSVAVTVVGLIGFRLLRQRHQRIGISYLVARILEAILLAGGIGLVAFNGSDNADTVGYLLAMVALGLGSVPFCQALGRERWLPWWLAGWGIVGYSALTAGALLELATGHDVAVYFAAPSGLFELVLGLYLLGQGFTERGPRPSPATGDLSNDKHNEDRRDRKGILSRH